MEESKPLTCYCCNEPYNETDKFCEHCGYPFQASPEEQKQFSINYTTLSFEKDVVKHRIREARVVLLIIAIFTVILSIITFIQRSETGIFVVNLHLALVYAGLSFWAKKKAFAALLTGGLIYVSIIILNAFIAPESMASGIIFKVIFIVMFIKASYGAYKYKV
jgi:hypothetical protein